MAFNHTLSAILRGHWLIDKQWADAQLPMVIQLIEGKPFDFGFKNSEIDINPKMMAAGSGRLFSVKPGSD